MRSNASIPRVCQQCGTPFTAQANRVRRGQGLFCSRHCVHLSKHRDPVLRFWKNVQKQESGCWLWTGPEGGRGYGVFWVDGRLVRAHRFSYEHHIGPIPHGLQVCHNCPTGDNRLCVNPDHLFVGTQRDNVIDIYAKGRYHRRNPTSARGERAGAAKLTDDQVRAIRAAYAAGEYQRVIAARYGVRQGAVWAICARKTWRHIT